MQKQKIRQNKTKEYKIENMQRYKNTKNKGLWKKETKNTGRAKPSFPEFANAFQEKLAVQQWQQQQWGMWSPRFKTQSVHIFKGHQFHPTTNSVF